jgi:hypothetical protein
MKSQRKQDVLITLALLLFSVRVIAQTGSGSLNGQITDPSGGAIPAAMVTATGAQGAVKAAETNLEGRYTISGLAPGKYTLRASAKNFALFEKNVEVAAG